MKRICRIGPLLGVVTTAFATIIPSGTPAELTRLSRKQTRRYGGSGQPIGSSARGERAAPNGGSPNLTKFLRVPGGGNNRPQ